MDEEMILEEEENGAETIQKLKKKLKKCLEERGEYLDGWQRAKADLVNARKTMDEERGETIAFANKALLASLLPILDSFDLAFSADAKDAEWQKGIGQIRAQLESVLKEHGLSAFDDTGKPFDPARHESVALRDVKKREEDQMIVEVLQKGYELHGTVLRPAKVAIGNYSK